jgi:hypothetical protein
MGVVRLSLVFLHLLGMAVLVAMFFVQRRTAPEGPLNKGWLHGIGLQLTTGVALYVLAPLTGRGYDHVKLGLKTVILVAIALLAFTYVNKAKIPSWLAPLLLGLTVLNVGIAVYWT